MKYTNSQSKVAAMTHYCNFWRYFRE